MLLLLATLLTSPVPAESGDWREFDRRQTGMAESAYHYDAARLVRRGARLRVWIRFEGHFSGIPDPKHLEHREVDCTRRRSRILGGTVDHGFGSPTQLRRQYRTRRIAPGSVEAALADRLCT